ncbi:unnamed protein product [Protopolystoma xenopodis]|uniref:Uncharacterized protein n=1 Tax=Protopolystoma xenopodis TaxID=117903 RepID=A0A3S5AMD2_9PLAT|nr:unnamed protein product [Protopolystoma xenopodis]
MLPPCLNRVFVVRPDQKLSRVHVSSLAHPKLSVEEQRTRNVNVTNGSLESEARRPHKLMIKRQGCLARVWLNDENVLPAGQARLLLQSQVPCDMQDRLTFRVPKAIKSANKGGQIFMLIGFVHLT